MVKNSNRPVRKKITLNVDEKLESFAAETGHSVSEIVEGISRPLSSFLSEYSWELKKGESVETTLERVVEVSKIGWPIDEQIRNSLGIKLKHFVLGDVNVDFGKQLFWVRYEALKGFNETIHTVSVRVERGEAQMDFSAGGPPLTLQGNFGDIVELFEDDLLDSMEGYEFEYDADSEPGTIFLVLTAESFEYLPSIADVSRIFKRLRKFLEKYQS